MPTRAEALRWLRLGFISFGGPAGQIAIMHRELVERRRWISERRFLHALNYCMVLPGPEAQQLATYIGWLMHRGWGGIVAGGLFVLPSLFILVALSWVYLAYGNLPVIAGLFYGHQAGGHRAGGACGLARRIACARERWLWAIAAFAFVAIFALDLPFRHRARGRADRPWRRRPAPDKFASAAARRRTRPTARPDRRPRRRRAHARSAGAPAHGCCWFACLWALALAPAALGWQGVDPDGLVLHQAALLTFGGAYAVLPCLPGRREHHQWLDAAQMIDGSRSADDARPPIMVVAFVGFVGGWTQAVFGSDALFLSGAAAATVVTFFTFLPSFFFILLGGARSIESTHGKLEFTRAADRHHRCAWSASSSTLRCSSPGTRCGYKAWRPLRDGPRPSSALAAGLSALFRLRQA